MAVCSECGTAVEGAEHFCGNCGAQVPPTSAEFKTINTGGRSEVSSPGVSSEDPESDMAGSASRSEDSASVSSSAETPSDKTISSTSSEESSTGGMRVSRTSSTSNKGTTGGHQPAIKQLEPGTLLNGRYEIVRRIGGGGMGAVYLAKDRNLGDAPRAVKEMVQSHIDEAQHEKAIADFKRESLLLTSLEHPSIPTIYDYFYDSMSGRFYLVMKYIPGGDLSARLRKAAGGRADEVSVSEWGIQIADVLHYLHTRTQPIIYRDLKPANVMIDSNTNRVMLIDFGIARWVNRQEKGVTAVGTMGYAPPELFSGQADPRVDIYSLGATMFHLLTGADPQDNPLLIFDFTKNPRPRQINPALSSEMEQILMRAVEYKPEQRFQSGAEMRDVLTEHLRTTWAAKPCAFRWSIAVFAAGVLPETMCSARIAARVSRWPAARVRRSGRRGPRRNWWLPELLSWTLRFYCRKTATCSAARIRNPIFFPT